MFKNYLKTVIRSLWKHKTFSFINIMGFAFSSAVCLAILLFIINEKSYDKYHENIDNLYRVIDTEHNYSTIDYRVKDILVNHYPEIEKGCFILQNTQNVNTYYKDNAVMVENIISADNNFFDLFTIPLIHGDYSKPLQNLNSVILTESSAKKIFGDEDALGKIVTIRTKTQLIVSGVIEDFPENSSISAGMIVNAENDDFKFYFSCDNSDDSTTYQYPFNIYLQLRDNVDIVEFEKRLNENPDLFYPYGKEVALLSVKDMYLHDYSRGSGTKKGNPALLNILSIIAIIVLFLAIVNYINLTAAQQNRRNKEIGVRKTVGANRATIIIHFLVESIVIILISLIISILILKIILPFFSSMTGSHLRLASLFNFTIGIYVFLSAIGIGILAGIGPAILFSSFDPVKMLHGRMFKSGGKNYMRTVLTVFQFTTSVILIICLLVIHKQIKFAKHKNLGFNQESLLRLDVPTRFTNALILKDKFLMQPQVMDVSLSHGCPGKINHVMGINEPGKDGSLQIIYADSSFIKTLGMRIVKGRICRPGDYGNSCYFNETAYKYLEWDDLVDKKFNNGRDGGYNVIGVVEDFHTSSLHNNIKPLAILLTDDGSANVISLRIAPAHLAETMDYIQKSWKEVYPHHQIQYLFYDDWIDAMYRKEENLARIVGTFAGLAIFISCLGILGLAIFSSESRRKEVGIRKVHGASIGNILLMMNKEYLKGVIAAIVLASPIAWLIMSRWLQDFAYRTAINWWIFLIAGLIAILIALLTISHQVFKAATANPIKSLRYE